MKTMRKLITLVSFLLIAVATSNAQITVNDTVTFQGDTSYSCFLKIRPTLDINDTIVVVEVYPYTSKEKYELNPYYTTLFNEIKGVLRAEYTYHRDTDGADILLFALNKFRETLLADTPFEEENIIIENLTGE